VPLRRPSDRAILLSTYTSIPDKPDSV